MNCCRSLVVAPILALMMTVGCTGRSHQVANPVLGPVPPRIPLAQTEQEADPSQPSIRSQNSGVQMASFNDESLPLEMTDIIAEVNGEPILAHMVLDRYSREIQQLKQQSKPAKVREYQLSKIEKDLPALIDQTIMVDALKQTMKPEQLKSIEDQLDKYFEQEVQDLMKKTNTGSPTELEGVLQTQGLSLVTLRQQFGDRQLAGQYMRGKLDFEPTVSHDELTERYQQNIDEYTQKPEVKWQQIDFEYQKHGGVEQAEAAAAQLLREIQAGQISFDDAAHDRSDSPLADQGGHRDWTNPENLVDTDLQHVLNQLEIQAISAPISSKNACLLVMVTGRREARTIPFHEIQTELKATMAQEKKQARGQAIINDLKSHAVIHSILDQPISGG